MAHQFKFVSFPHKLLIGEDTHHHHLLEAEFGHNIFPPETIAIGTGVFQGDAIVGIGFDYGSQADRDHAIEQIRDWALGKGYTVNDYLYDIYTKEASIYDRNFNYNHAFWWYDGKLHVGANHPAIIEGVGWDKYDLNQPGIFGWIIGDEDGTVAAEIYSDFYAQDYDESEIEDLLAALRKRWPVTEIVYGPDTETVREMEEYFDPREAALRYIDKVSSF